MGSFDDSFDAEEVDVGFDFNWEDMFPTSVANPVTPPAEQQQECAAMVVSPVSDDEESKWDGSIPIKDECPQTPNSGHESEEVQIGGSIQKKDDAESELNEVEIGEKKSVYVATSSHLDSAHDH